MAKRQRGPGAASDDDGSDGEVVFVSESRPADIYPHARFDCPVHPLARGPELHCDKCCCAVCEVPAPCAHWHEHCGHTRAQFMARMKAAREERAEAWLKGLPPPTPSAASARALALLASPPYSPMRYTALSFLMHCGRDEEGVVTSVTSSHHEEGVAHVTPGVAREVLNALLELGEVVEFEGALRAATVEPAPA